MTPRLDREDEASLLRLVQWRVRQWRGNPEYDDILGESYLKAWQSYCRAVELGSPCPLAVAAHGAGFGPKEWLYRWFRRLGLGFTAGPQGGLPLSEADQIPAPSPEKSALDRVEARALWEYLRSNCTPRQWEIIERLFGQEETVQEIARALGIKTHTVGRVRENGFDRCRRKGREQIASFPRPPESYPCCGRGHRLSEENLVHRAGRQPRCRLCCREYVRAGRARRRSRAQDGADTASARPAGPGATAGENGAGKGS